MKLFGIRQSFLVTLIAIASCVGCTHDVQTTPAAKSSSAPPTPEESFETIFDTFRRRIEDTPVGFVVSGSTSQTSMLGSNKVSKELIPPTEEGGVYKAVITVMSESRYSITRTKESDDDSNDANQNKKSNDPLAETNAAGEPVDSQLPKPDLGKNRVPTSMLPTQDKQDTRKYALEYKNGRWELMTELDKETEQSIQNAFKNALATQNTE